MADTEIPLISIENARLEDAPHIAALLAQAFPELYHFAFGRQREENVTRLLTALYRAGTLSLERTRLARQDGKPVGVMILHVGKAIGRGSLRQFGHALRTTALHTEQGSRFHLRGAAWLRAWAGGAFLNMALQSRIPHASDLLYIEALVVHEAVRGQGIGTRLLADAEQQARADGRTRLALHVLARNAGARRLYERVGFVLPTGPLAVPRLRWPGWLAARRQRSPSPHTAYLLIRSLPAPPLSSPSLPGASR